MTERKRVTAYGAAVVLAVCVVAVSPVEAQPTPVHRFFWSIDGGGQSGSQQLQDLGPVGQVFGEDQTVETDYNIDRGAGIFRSHLTVVVKRNFAVGVGFTREAVSGTADVTVEVPHPIFVGRPRVASRSLSGLAHRESMYHFRAAWIVPLDDRVDLQIYGGPSIIHADQAVVTGALSREVGSPFTQVALSSVTRVGMTKTGLGFNVGLDFAYMFGTYYGVGGFVQYAGGALDFDMLGGPTSVTIGGIQYGGGLRLRY